MTEDSYVDTRVREFADHIQCDPELAQELYFEHKVSEALDNEQKASVDRELRPCGSSAITWIKRLKHAKRFLSITMFYGIHYEFRG